MGIEELTALIWRRRFIFASVSLLCVAAIAAITLALPKTYEATATIFVTPERGPTLDITQGEQVARTYTALASNPNVAEEVLAELDEPLTRDELLERMSFAPVERTQLIQITASGDSAAEAQALANTYAEVFVVRADEQFQLGKAPTSISVSEPAVLPLEAASPNVPLYLGFGVIFSLLLGFVAALLRDKLDRRLQISDDQDSLFERPILARIPRSEPKELQAGAAPGELSDALRVLRTNIELSPGGPIRSILVTSSGVGEGKTTIAANLALAMASDGDRVTLVEADLRHPTLDRTALSAATDSKRGLSQLLAGRITQTDAILKNASMPNLQVISAGTPAPESGRLLRSGRMRELIQGLQREGDWVIVDSPPISVGDDALVLSAVTDATLFVVDPSKTLAGGARAGLHQLRTVGAEILGIAVNGTPPTHHDYYAEAQLRRIDSFEGIADSSPSRARKRS